MDSISERPLGSKSEPPLAPPMASPVRNFKDLFETQEFENALVHAGVETQTALERTDSGIELDTIALVDLYLSLVVNPLHPERNCPSWLNNTFQNFILFVFPIAVRRGCNVSRTL